MHQCLKAVILACCLCSVKGQPANEGTETAGDRLLILLVILIIITTIALWEASRRVVGFVVPKNEPRELFREDPDTQPDAEDDLPLPPPAEEPPADSEEEERVRLERERELVRLQAVADEAQAAYEEGLRQRGVRVYGPEPDDEPNPRPPRAPEHPAHQGPESSLRSLNY